MSRFGDMGYDDGLAKGLVRYQQARDLHFLTFSCYRRQPHLGTKCARETFERSLEAMRRRHEFYVTAYVVMPEHVHSLVSEPRRALLSKAIQALKLSVAAQCRERPFWQPRYYDFNVYSERKCRAKRRYIHRNPVTRGRVEQPLDWSWSSFRHWWTGERGTVEIESHWTAMQGEAALNPMSQQQGHGAPDPGGRILRYGPPQPPASMRG